MPRPARSCADDWLAHLLAHPITRQFGSELVAVVLLVLPVLPPFCSAQRAGSAASIGAASRTTLKTAWRVLPGALAQIHSLTVGSAACPVMPVQSPQREQNRLPEPTPPTALVSKRLSRLSASTLRRTTHI